MHSAWHFLFLHRFIIRLMFFGIPIESLSLKSLLDDGSMLLSPLDIFGRQMTF